MFHAEIYQATHQLNQKRWPEGGYSQGKKPAHISAGHLYTVFYSPMVPLVMVIGT